MAGDGDHLGIEREPGERVAERLCGRGRAAHADLAAGQALEVLGPARAQQHARAVDEGEQREIDQLAPGKGLGGRAAEDVDPAVLDRLEPVFSRDRDVLELDLGEAERPA